MSSLSIPIQVHTGYPSTIRQEKKIRGMQIGKAKIKLSLLTNYTIVYVDNLKNWKKSPGINSVSITKWKDSKLIYKQNKTKQK